MDDVIKIEIIGNNIWIDTEGSNHIDSVSYGLSNINDNPDNLQTRKHKIISSFEDYIMNHYRCDDNV